MRGVWMVLLGTLLGLTACTSRPVEPTRASRRAIDTLYQKQVLLLQPEIDSACAVLYEGYFQSAKDSILALRLQEMNELVK